MQTESIVQPPVPSQPTEAATRGVLGTSRTPRLPHDDTAGAVNPTAHSGRLVYAKPEDLPSFPTVGLDANGSAASAAASLGWANKKSPELWKPNRSTSASTAAMMAKDYKVAPAWEPVTSSHSAKAALIAARLADNVGPHPVATTGAGHSAANMAFKSDFSSLPRNGRADTLERQRSLVAAKGAMATRQRAKSSPAPKETYPDEANAAANALAAATRAQVPSRSLTITERTGAVPYTTMNRQMFTSRPPVKPEVDEQKKADMLHASAVAMAKKMFNQQQKMIDAKKAHETTSAGDKPRDRDQLDSISDDGQPTHLTTLQDAAYKQAQARLAKIQQDNLQARDYRDYYGTKAPTRRFSIKTKLRRRSSSDGAVIEDRKRSQQIRQQMSSFSNKLSEVDDKKRQHDQEVLLAAAQRNVHARLKGMDEKISAETGMVPPATLTQWELKAHAAAQAQSYDRKGEPQGQIDIGAGKYMSQDEIDAIAARRVQPVLDEINEKAEKEHARQTELRLDMERKKEEQEIEKARQKEIHDISRKIKEQEKHEQREKRAEEKQEAKAKKEEEKAAKAQQKRLAKGEKPGDAAGLDLPASVPDEPRGEMVTMNSLGQPVRVSTQEPGGAPNTAITGEGESPEEPTSPKSPDERSSRGKVRTWFKSHFSRGSKPSNDDKSREKSATGSFVGGAALTGMEGNDSATSLDNRSASVRAVAMAGRKSSDRSAISKGRSRKQRKKKNGDSGAVSPLSSESEDEFFRDEARNQMAISLTPPRPIRDSSSNTSQSPSRDSRFHEII